MFYKQIATQKTNYKDYNILCDLIPNPFLQATTKLKNKTSKWGQKYLNSLKSTMTMFILLLLLSILKSLLSIMTKTSMKIILFDIFSWISHVCLDTSWILKINWIVHCVLNAWLYIVGRSDASTSGPGPMYVFRAHICLFRFPMYMLWAGSAVFNARARQVMFGPTIRPNL